MRLPWAFYFALAVTGRTTNLLHQATRFCRKRSQ